MKTPQPVSSTSLFDTLVAETPAETNNFVEHSLAIAHQIELVLDQKGMLQKDLAQAMGKTEAEISKWLCGFHNFTIKTISKIEAVLDAKIILTPHKFQEDK
jgi:predicted XRE-type DNA-binding protein